jgi:hypothetical protein
MTTRRLSHQREDQPKATMPGNMLALDIVSFTYLNRSHVVVGLLLLEP